MWPLALVARGADSRADRQGRRDGAGPCNLVFRVLLGYLLVLLGFYWVFIGFIGALLGFFVGFRRGSIGFDWVLLGLYWVFGRAWGFRVWVSMLQPHAGIRG